MTKGEKAKEIFIQGYNCAQAVLMSYSEEFGIDRKTAARISCGLGGGIARTRETCGAVLGAVMVISLRYSDGSPDDKKKAYSAGSAFIQEFEEHNGSSLCKVLLGLEQKENSSVPEARTKEYYQKRPCAELVACAAEMVEKYLND